jgi:hypothetical protein
MTPRCHFLLIPQANEPQWATWTHLEAALYYALAFGWPVFPLDGKIPFKGTQGFKDASTSHALIERWWRKHPEAGIGIPTGVRTGVVVLDVDKHHGGLLSLEQIQQRFGPLPCTRTCLTGNDGFHLWFRYPKGASLRNRTELGDYPGIDTRGDGGYIVVPNSRHPNGQLYEWLNEGRIEACPDWIIALSQPPPRTPPVSSGWVGRPSGYFHGRPATGIGEYWLHVARSVAHKRASCGNRNNVGYWLARKVIQAGLSPHEAEMVMREYAACVPAGDHPYTLEEALATLESALHS